ncbi:hypothetical protein GCM10010533_57790 [Mycolicibacterium pallens]|nr:hypothetical protein BOH72_26950 [Mycobacterium sp. WY10]
MINAVFCAAAACTKASGAKDAAAAVRAEMPVSRRLQASAASSNGESAGGVCGADGSDCAVGVAVAGTEVIDWARTVDTGRDRPDAAFGAALCLAGPAVV